MIQANQQTTTIDTWPYYEFEDFINLLNKRNEDEKKSREDGEKKQNSGTNSSDYKNMMKTANSFNPSNFKFPH
jgi:hypothetical protein